MKKQLKEVVMLKTLVAVMSFSFFFFLFLATTAAEEQIVDVEAEVSESFSNWLYSDAVKNKIVGSGITITTVIIGVGVYYLIKAF